jgi:peptidoglycan/LPS O-acetylase OafA/YrhL
MDTFALGALLAIAARSGDMLRRLAKYAPVVAAGSFAVVAALFVANGGLSILDASVQTIGFTALGLLFAAILATSVTAQAGSLPQRIFASAQLTWLGRYAYGLYVVHVLVAFTLANRILQVSWLGDIYLREFAGFKAPANALTAATGIAISCAIAWASWHLYESQFLKLKRFVPYGRGERRVRTPQVPPSVSEQPTMSVP